MMKVCGLTAVQAVGVALSIPMGRTPMHKCQELAPKVVRHLMAMGFVVTPIRKRDRRRIMNRAHRANRTTGDKRP